ncbi:nickel/cobalt transporter [Ahrensia marina]|uniref:Nickel/cobalt efflux system n=1 Tax=Ahrensia marina TaxID=1514904 RepID=A0A0M9GLR2_9HYPH|nr:nickel/cobalt transporter [Ahrensia marina]KPB00409.1 delayed-early response protein/equilibrative nucleoside transporter [Ahrensia marina]
MLVKWRFAIAALVLVGACSSVYAQSSLGIGGAEQPVAPSGGLFGSFFTWIGTEQRAFYRSMTNALKTMRQDGSAVWLLVGLSFLYGVLHAAGPGHGKVVISSYMVANETALRRGVGLALASSVLQAISAIVLVGAGFLLLRGTSVSMTDASQWLEIGSYILIIAFGVWLLWRKLKGFYARKHESHAHKSGGHNHAHDHHHHDHSAGEVCSSCGHVHMPSPSTVDRPLDWRSAGAAIFAVGIRPCSGAVIVFSFALLNGLYAGGVVSVFAMAFGTAITVSILAILSVTAKNAALALSKSPVMNERLHLGIEVFGAGLLIVLGSLLLAGALTLYL